VAVAELGLVGWRWLDVRWLGRSWFLDPYYQHGLVTALVAIGFIGWRWHALRLSETKAPGGLSQTGLRSREGPVLRTAWWRRTAGPSQGRGPRPAPELARGARGWWLAGAALALGIGVGWSSRFLTCLGLLMAFRGWVEVFMGVKWARPLAGPLVLFGSAIPLPYLPELTALLQLLTVMVSTTVLSAVGLPITHDGVTLLLPKGALIIGEGCSGISSLVSLTTVVIFFLCLMPARRLTRWTFALGVIPMALVGNWLRVVGLGVVGSRWGEHAAVQYWHGASGWVSFGLILGVLAGVWWIMEAKRVPEGAVG